MVEIEGGLHNAPYLSIPSNWERQQAIDRSVSFSFVPVNRREQSGFHGNFLLLCKKKQESVHNYLVERRESIYNSRCVVSSLKEER